MKKVGFDNQKYLEMQSGRIRERIAEFGGKLYLATNSAHFMRTQGNQFALQFRC